MRILTLDKPKLWSNDWFKAWQFLLLVAVNSPFKGLREEVRHRLGICLDRNIKVARLLKNSFAIKVGENEYQETFYGKDVFARSVKSELMWLWKTIHKYDVHFANYISPKLNLGFDTLTAYPDANPETSTVDGYVSRYMTNSTFAELRSGSGTNTEDSNSVIGAELYVISSSTNYFDILKRGFFTIDTSSIGSDSSLSGAIFSLYGDAKGNAQGSTLLNVAGASPASNVAITTSDYQNISRTSFGTIDYDNFLSAQYNEITFNTDGNNAISLTSITKLSIQLGWDLSNSYTGTWSSGASRTFYQCKSSDAGATYAPKLTVTYTLPITFIPQIIMV